MRVVNLGALLLSLVLAGCAGEPVPPTAGPLPELLPLPGAVGGRPGGPTSPVSPTSRRGQLAPRTPLQLTLGHCGLLSPIDIDGSLWRPVGADDGAGGPLSEDHMGELINATSVSLTLLLPEAALIDTPLGARILIVRTAGVQAYPMCD